MADSTTASGSKYFPKGGAGLTFLALFCICFMTFGSYFIYDTPGSIGYGALCLYDKNPDCDGRADADSKLAYAATFPRSECLKLNESNCEHHVNCTWDLTYSSKGAVCRGRFSDSLTVDTCAGACWEAGIWNRTSAPPTVAAVENGSWCRCGVEKHLADPLPLEMCQLQNDKKSPNGTAVACSGDSFSPCGGLEATAAYNISCPLQTIEMFFEHRRKQYSSAMNLALYSAYSYPNTFLCLIGGMIIDRIGLRLSAVIFSVLICSGQLVFLLGTSIAQWPVMLVGRILFGLGGESLTVAQSAYTARWFQSTPFMALAFGITLSFTRIGSAVAFTVTPIIAKDVSIPVAIWVGAGACLGSLCFILILAALDKVGENKGVVSPAKADDGFDPGQVLRLPMAHWLLTIVCVMFYVAILSFNTLGTNFFQTKWNVSLTTAAGYVAIYTYTSAAASPIIGGLVDRVGYSLVWMFAACLLAIGTYLCMIFTTVVPPYVLMGAIGVSLTMISATLWAGVPLVVTDENLLGTAYGAMTAVQNLGLATMPLIVGAIRDSDAAAFEGNPLTRFYVCLAILIGFACIAAIMIVVLFFYDRAHGGILMSSAAQRLAAAGKDAHSRSVANIRSQGKFATSAAVLRRSAWLAEVPAAPVPALTSLSGVFSNSQGALQAEGGPAGNAAVFGIPADADDAEAGMDERSPLLGAGR